MRRGKKKLKESFQNETKGWDKARRLRRKRTKLKRRDEARRDKQFILSFIPAFIC